MKKAKLSKGASAAKIKWDTTKHNRDKNSGRFTFKPGTEEFKAEPFGPGKTSNVKSSDVIKLHVTSNPKKAGSNAAADFDKYKDGMTVGEFNTAVGSGKMAKLHLGHDTKKGFITIHDPATLPKAPPLEPPPPPPPPKLSYSDYVITSKTGGVNSVDKIMVIAGGNPKKPGTKAAEAFAQYKDEMTVGEFHAIMGGKKQGQEHILHDLKKGYIAIHDPVSLHAMQTGPSSPGAVAAGLKFKDKDLGVITQNPFTLGSKNYADFEEHADLLGLTTATKAAKMINPATSTPKPKTLADLDDDDIMVSNFGTEFHVGKFKKVQDDVDKATADTNLANGTWTVKAKPVPLGDDDMIQSPNSAVSYTAKEYKKLTGYDDATVQKHIASGKLMHKPAAGAAAPKPEVTTMKAGELLLNPKPKPTIPAHQTLADDAEITTSLGTKYTVAAYKKMWKENGMDEDVSITKMNGYIASGTITVSKLGGTTLKDDDVIETFLGNKMTVKEYKAKFTANDDDIKHDFTNGDIKLATKVSAATGIPPVEIKPATLKVSSIPEEDYGKYDALLLTDTNPYTHASDKWIKFQAIHITSSYSGAGKSMTLSKYMNTKALDPAQKKVVLQQMIDDGHVKLVSPAEKAAVQKAKDDLVKAEAAAMHAKAATKHSVHYASIKPAKWQDGGDGPDDRWGKNKVAGMHDLKAPGKTEIMEKTRLAVGLPFHNNQAPSVGHYTGNGYISINANLRSKTKGFAAMGPTEKNHVKNLDKLMGYTKEDAIMWRGLSSEGGPEKLNSMPPPTEFYDMGFSSMSHNPNVSLNFAGYTQIGTHRKVLFRVRVPAGTKAAFIGRNYTEKEGMKDEAEIIGARGTRFKYISTVKDYVMDSYGTKVDIVELEIVNGSGGNI